MITPSGKAPFSLSLVLGIAAAGVLVAIYFIVHAFPLLLATAAVLVLVVVAVVFRGISRLEVSPGSLRIRVPFYGRTLPIHELDLSRARVVDLSIETGLRPRIRTNGIGLPGYSVGWFRLKDKQKALAALTGRQNVVHIPTSGGYCLLLSTLEPERFLESLKQNSPGS